VVRKKRVAWLLCLLLLLLVSAWWLEAPFTWSQSLAERALRHHDAHGALLWIARMRSLSAHPAPADLLAARAYLQINNNGAAQAAVARAKKWGAPEEQIRAYWFMIAAQRGDADASERLFASADQLPLPIEAYEAIVRCGQIHGHLDRAEMVLNQLAKAGEAPAVVAYQLGRNREIAEDFEGAAEHFRRAMKLEPGMKRSAFRCGKCYAHLRRFDQAVTMFRLASQSPVYNVISSIELASVLWELNELQEARRTIEPCLTADPLKLEARYLEVDEFVDADRAALVGARIYDALAEHERAADLLERVLAYNHRDFEARGLLIKNLRVLGRDSDAEALARLQSEMLAERQRGRQLRLELDNEKGNAPQAIAKRCELAELYWNVESIAEARLALSEILELDPDCERAKQLLSKINAEQAIVRGYGGSDPSSAPRRIDATATH